MKNPGTETTAASAELAKLEQARDEARDAVRVERRKVRAYEAETDRLRGEYQAHFHEYPEQYEDGGAPLPETDAAKMSAEIQRGDIGIPTASEYRRNWVKAGG